ncbi:hypothetical protein GUITHDRAFT_99462 [Guillardia theta CCMP2712]|uniref:Pyrroline-5-carboxylate reductase catalytic N-terminal domain-containing protein n=1 Tax=Guillardia theta (strain CCMP2712) TaxID=905079 RepID=L1K388_GUITC|nr:hypothetical protein GUITHDRAFT_99462 [Guillardia theta CCMP2712]EKX54813.1 hypothetical protein GUITHDRAFT_99462 [Guillardia theta CCMP2712]|eukprot:XP_005841793.1 hypothetical protein GUITHDRAFT_99462 [Guillardia theta CCMP2712]
MDLLQSKDEEDVNFESLFGSLEKYISVEAVDGTVKQYYDDMIYMLKIFPMQCLYLSCCFHKALTQAYIFRRQLLRQELSNSRKFYGNIKCWVIEVRNLEYKRLETSDFDQNQIPCLVARLSIEGLSRSTTKFTPIRSFDDTLEPARINQDFEFFVKRPTSLIYVDLLYLNEAAEEGSLEREQLFGHAAIPIRRFESQKNVREWFKLVRNDGTIGEVKLRIQYSFKEESMSIWDAERGIPRSVESGGPHFTLGMIGVGQIGTKILESLLRCESFDGGNVIVSTRRPQKLSAYEKLGVTAMLDNSAVASRADLVIVCCPPSSLNAVARDVRGRLKSTTLVLSCVAGVASERLAGLFGISPRNVFRPSIDVKVGGGGACTSGVTPWQEGLKEGEAWELLYNVFVSVISNVGIPERIANNIVSKSLEGMLEELCIRGEHVPLSHLEEGAAVNVLPGPNDVDVRRGTVLSRIPDERDEYIVSVQDKEVRVRRNRVERVSKDGTTIEEEEEGFLVMTEAVKGFDDSKEKMMKYFESVAERSTTGLERVGGKKSVTIASSAKQ